MSGLPALAGPVGLLGLAPAAPTPIPTPHVDWPTIAPVVALFGAALGIVLLLARCRRRAHLLAARGSVVIAFAGLGTAAAFLFYQWHIVRETGGYETFSGEIAVDGLAVFVQAILVGACML